METNVCLDNEIQANRVIGQFPKFLWYTPGTSDVLEAAILSVCTDSSCLCVREQASRRDQGPSILSRAREQRSRYGAKPREYLHSVCKHDLANVIPADHSVWIEHSARTARSGSTERSAACCWCTACPLKGTNRHRPNVV